MTRGKDKPISWRSLAELENDQEFLEFVANEFPEPYQEQAPGSAGRRRFMQLMGASFALSGATGCRWPQEKLAPLARRPGNRVPGEARYYATTMDIAGMAIGLHVKSYDGRPIKVEGNPGSPSSLGGSSALHQASVLGLYDPDRSRTVMRRQTSRTTSSWDAFTAFATPHFGELSAAAGRTLRILSESSSSPSVAAMRRLLEARFPQARFIEYEPALGDGDRLGSELAFGAPYRVIFRPERARVVVSLDADLLGHTTSGSVAYARAIAAERAPERGHMSRIYCIESTPTPLGTIADHRLALRSSLVKAVVAHLDAAIGAKARPLPELGPAQPEPDAAFLKDPGVEKFLRVLVSDLLDPHHLGKSMIAVGAHQPPEVHALVHRINAMLGNAGNAVAYLEEPKAKGPSQLTALGDLVKEMKAGSVDTLVILGGNPVLTSPANLDFAGALAKVPHSIHLSLYDDETSRGAEWHLPMAHYLESWGDARAHDGSIHVAQPLIEPLFDGKSAIELLAVLARHEKPHGLDIVRETLSAAAPSERAFRRAIHDGFIANTKTPTAVPAVRPLPRPLEWSKAERAGLGAENGQLEITFAADAKVFDGRFTNNAWLQELPEPLSKLTWDNAALLSPKTASALGVEDGYLVTLSLGERKVTLPALQQPGQAEGCVRVVIGYGRKLAGQIGGSDAHEVAPVGVDVTPLRTTENFFFGAGLNVTRAGGKQSLATTQDLHAIDRVGASGVAERLSELVRQGTLEEYDKDPHFAKEEVHHKPLLNLYRDPVSYDGYKWGMSVDLNKCTGCSACVVACQAENNIPVVGKDRVLRGREMLWLRIDRYYKGSADDPEVTNQPVPCQQCENAPCEQVCPVGATGHSHEGLNDMTYNRCIGTRYCSNNCPYKVRRFNFFNYNLDTLGTTPYTGTDDPAAKLKSMVFNPDVTVRSRGVMEKCTYCVQRIQNAKIKAKNAKRVVEDGEVKTACQQACPPGAIVFGDLNSKSSVASLQALPRAYALLGELNNRPRTLYLARVKNPHPELS